MRTLLLIAVTLLALVVTLGSGSAQPAGSDGRICERLPPKDLLARSYNFPTGKEPREPTYVADALLIRGEGIATLSAATDEKLRKNVSRAASGGQLLLVVKRHPKISEEDWKTTYIYGAAQTEEKNAEGEAAAMEAIGISVRDRSNDMALLDVTLPLAKDRGPIDKWLLVAVFCNAKDSKLLGHASAKVSLVSWSFSFYTTAIVMAVFWLLLAFATWQFYKEKFERLWRDDQTIRYKQRYGDTDRSLRTWTYLQCINPLFISQDSLGYASFARLQILMFTTIVGTMLLYFFIHSGVLSELSDTILTTLGITVAGSTIGRAVGDWSGVKATNRQWLIGRGFIEPPIDRPRWNQLFSANGEIDVVKVQAFMFTGLIAVAIVVNGTSGLGSLTVPSQILYLSGISQAAYVAGRLAPAATVKKLDEDIDGLRKAAHEAIEKPNDEELKAKFEWARRAAEKALADTYGEHFVADTFNKDPQNPNHYS